MKDIKLNTNTNPFGLAGEMRYDLDIDSGDFASTEPTRQHQELLLLTSQGHWRSAPLVGVGLHDFINDDDPADMMRSVRLQFSRDGMKISRLTASDEATLNVIAEYK